MRWLAGALTVSLLLGAMRAYAADPTVAWYRFEDGQVGDVVAGNMQVPDSGPNGLHGWTPYGCHAERVEGIAPGSNLAWDIDGLDDWFLVPDDPKLAIEGSITLEAWVMIRAYQSSAVSNFIVFRGDSTPGWDAYCLALNRSDDLIFRIEGPGGRDGGPAPTAECRFQWFGTPIHVAGVFNANTGFVGLYVNGELVDSLTTGVRPRARLNPAMGPGVGVGGYHGGADASFAIDGIIDEVRISSVALDPSALLCGELPNLEWVGTKGFTDDGVEPDCGPPGTSFLFAVRCPAQPGAEAAVRLELRRNGRDMQTVQMSRAGALPESDAVVYRTRVELDEGEWDYRFVSPGSGGAPCSWHPGPTVTDAEKVGEPRPAHRG